MHQPHIHILHAEPIQGVFLPIDSAFQPFQGDNDWHGVRGHWCEIAEKGTMLAEAAVVQFHLERGVSAVFVVSGGLDAHPEHEAQPSPEVQQVGSPCSPAALVGRQKAEFHFFEHVQLLVAHALVHGGRNRLALSV